MEEELKILDTQLKEQSDAIKKKYNQLIKDEIKEAKDKIEELKKVVKKKYEKKTRKSIPKAVKDKVWDICIGKEKGIGPCYCCSSDIDSKKFDCGHIISVANGGGDTIDNLKPICPTCNKSMGTENLEEFKKKHFPTKKKTRKTIPKAVKDKVWDICIGKEKGVSKCYCCSSDIDSKKFDCGHIVSVANGGSDTIDNLKPICATCNKSMGTENLEEFKKKYFPPKKKTRKAKPEPIVSETPPPYVAVE